MSLKRSRITVLLDHGEYVRFDEYCESRGYKKSTLIARLIRDHLDSEKFAAQVELSFGDPETRRESHGHEASTWEA